MKKKQEHLNLDIPRELKESLRVLFDKPSRSLIQLWPTFSRCPYTTTDINLSMDGKGEWHYRNYTNTILGRRIIGRSTAYPFQ